MVNDKSALVGPVTYDLEPERHPLAIVNAKVRRYICLELCFAFVRATYALCFQLKEPYNAEPPPNQLIESFITPVPYFYKRNHGPIPVLESEEE